MANLTRLTPGVVGAVLTLGAAVSASDTFDNNGKVVLLVNNASGADIVATVDDLNSQALPGETRNPDVAITVAAGTRKAIGPFPTTRFNDSNGRVTVGFSAITSVTAVPIQL